MAGRDSGIEQERGSAAWSVVDPVWCEYSVVQFAIDTNVNVFFCDPRSPWRRRSNENTNGLIRQYYPKPVTPPEWAFPCPVHRQNSIRGQ